MTSKTELKQLIESMQSEIRDLKCEVSGLRNEVQMLRMNQHSVMSLPNINPMPNNPGDTAYKHPWERTVIFC